MNTDGHGFCAPKKRRRRGDLRQRVGKAHTLHEELACVGISKRAHGWVRVFASTIKGRQGLESGFAETDECAGQFQEQRRLLDLGS